MPKWVTAKNLITVGIAALTVTRDLAGVFDDLDFRVTFIPADLLGALLGILIFDLGVANRIDITRLIADLLICLHRNTRTTATRKGGSG